MEPPLQGPGFGNVGMQECPLSLPVIPARSQWAPCIQVPVGQRQVRPGAPVIPWTCCSCCCPGGSAMSPGPALPCLIPHPSVGSSPVPGELHPSRLPVLPKELQHSGSIPAAPRGASRSRALSAGVPSCPGIPVDVPPLPGAPGTPPAAPQVLPAHLCSS